MPERQRPGQVRDAILAYLREQPGDASLAEVQGGVEARLGGWVAPSSVRSYLRLNAQLASDAHRLFEQTGRGRYRLIREPRGR